MDDFKKIDQAMKLWHKLEERVRTTFSNVDYESLPEKPEGKVHYDFLGLDSQGKLEVDFVILTHICVQDEDLDKLTDEDLGPLRTMAKKVYYLHCLAENQAASQPENVL